MPESSALAVAELSGLLSNHARGDVVRQAAELVEGLTGTNDGLDELVRGAELIVPPLVGTLVVAAAGGGAGGGGGGGQAAAVRAQEEAMREELRRAGVSCAGALVNLSQRREMVPMLVQRGALLIKVPLKFLLLALLASRRSFRLCGWHGLGHHRAGSAA